MAARGLDGLARVHGRVVHARRVRVLARVLAELLPPDLSVLDVGSGDGRIAAALMELRPDLRVEGTDVLVRPDAVLPTVPFDGRRLPFGDGARDAVVLVDVVHHAESPRALLAEAARVARSVVVLKDHELRGLAAASTLRFMDWVGNRAHGVALPYHYLTPAEWESAFEEAGLVMDERRDRLGLYPWPARLWFERSLHFAARLVRRAP